MKHAYVCPCVTAQLMGKAKQKVKDALPTSPQKSEGRFESEKHGLLVCLLLGDSRKRHQTSFSLATVNILLNVRDFKNINSYIEMYTKHASIVFILECIV